MTAARSPPPLARGLGDRRREELERPYSPELPRAAVELRQIGQLSHVIETPQGFWVLKVAGIDRNTSTFAVLSQNASPARRCPRGSG